MATWDKQERSEHYAEAVQQPFNAAEIFAKAARSVVGVEGEMFGSGFFVSSGKPNSCEIATVPHVASGAVATVTVRDGTTYQARREFVNKRHDVAIYQLEGVRNPGAVCKELTVNPVQPTRGQSALAIGTAGDGWFGTELFGASPQSPAYRTGKILGVNGVPFVQAEKGIAVRGYSGGPWLDAAGKVIGITVGGDGKIAYGATATFLKEDLDSLHR